MSDEDKKEQINQILLEVQYEKDFYRHIAEVDDYDIIPIDSDSEVHILARQAMEAQCKEDNVKILYQVSYGDYSVVFCEGGGKIGIVPNDNPDGWFC